MLQDLSGHFRHTLHMKPTHRIKVGSTELLPGSFYCQNLVKKSHFCGKRQRPPALCCVCVYLLMSGPVWMEQRLKNKNLWDGKTPLKCVEKK